MCIDRQLRIKASTGCNGFIGVFQIELECFSEDMSKA